MDSADLEKQLVELCKRRIRRQQARVTRAEYAGRRATDRDQSATVWPVETRAKLWDVSPGHDPHHVLARRRAIAHSISEKIRACDYSPRAPHVFSVPKDKGNPRTVTAFELPDEAVSRLLYLSLTEKNDVRLGGRAYAYRPSVGAADAVEYVAACWNRTFRHYVAHFDLRGYFDNINHKYLMRQLMSAEIYSTAAEMSAVEGFINTSRVIPGVGVPQGTSISLFLSNLAAKPLDDTLEGLGVRYVRYADDILIWGDNYTDMARAVESVAAWSRQVGVPMNLEKSGGIALMSPDSPWISEFESKSHLDYLGYEIAADRVGIRTYGLGKMRRRMSSLIYENLLDAPRRGQQKTSRVTPTVDKDYMRLVAQLRRYLYGSLSENQVRRLVKSPTIPPIRLSGQVARYCAVSDTSDFVELDQWLRARVWLALRERASLLQSAVSDTPLIWLVQDPNRLREITMLTQSSGSVHIGVPSASRMARLVQRSMSAYGSQYVRSSSNVYGVG